MMKQSVSFTRKEIEKPSLNFSELRDRGIEYIQKLSGDDWTDYNSHDPGVTILEQLCYALTDLAFRTDLPIEDLLTPGKDIPIPPLNNAFFAPSQILNSHPFSIIDIRKMIIDEFDEIQNVWITRVENQGYEEKLNGIYDLAILPKISFMHSLKPDSDSGKEFLKKVDAFLRENRNLGEAFNGARLLKNKPLNIEFDITIDKEENVETAISKMFLALFEFIYCPVQYHSFKEMQDAGYTMEEIFSGPRLKRGFIKNESLKEKITEINTDKLQKLISKVKGINKCEVYQINTKSGNNESIKVKETEFFHLLDDTSAGNVADNRFGKIYSNLRVLINKKEFTSLNKQKIDSLFFETWSKKYRGYSVGHNKEDFFENNLKGTYRKPGEYHSIQHQFPTIYGIGEEGLSKHEPEERQAKALQLKAYLLLFEQHFANHLAQIENINEFFNIDYKAGKKQTYFTQDLSAIPNVNKSGNELIKEQLPVKTILEKRNVFLNRKNRIYDHLLARFGEELNDIPWKIALHLNLIKSEDDFNEILLQQKSDFLLNLENYSYYRTIGEFFTTGKTKRNPSGLEQIIMAKTGIWPRETDSTIPEFITPDAQSGLEEFISFENNEELNKRFRRLSPEEINQSYQKNSEVEFSNSGLKNLDLKTLFRETLNYKNYRISNSKTPDGKVMVIFQKEKDKWINFYEYNTEEEAVWSIKDFIDAFTEGNKMAERLFIIDHILLQDFLKESKYGFRFYDNYGELFIQPADDVWCEKENERYENLRKFYTLGKNKSSYYFEENNWVIKDATDKILFTIKPNAQKPEITKDEVFAQTLRLIRLFEGSDDAGGNLLFKEMEEIRFIGTKALKEENYAQRRLVYQRKLSDDLNLSDELKIIDEDFFNLQVSILFPDWPARFQDERFRDYVSDVIIERIPSHIANEILWIDYENLQVFEKQYNKWKELKLKSENSSSTSHELKEAAFKLYQIIMEFKKNKNFKN